MMKMMNKRVVAILRASARQTFDARVWVALPVAAVLLIGLQSQALADAELSVAVTYPELVVLGDTVQASMTLTNASTLPESQGALIVSEIRHTPSCDTDNEDPCPEGSREPRVFKIMSPATGRAGTACDGMTFNVTTPDPKTGEVEFVPTSGEVILVGSGPLASCTIDFSVDVNFFSWWPKDVDDTSRTIETFQLARATGTASLHGATVTGTGSRMLSIGYYWTSESSPNFPLYILRVGDEGIPVSFSLDNFSTLPYTWTVDGVEFIPSGGYFPQVPEYADPGVLVAKGPFTGRAGTACDGMTFDVRDPDPITGAIKILPPSGPLILEEGASCTVDFLVDVLKAPTKDVDKTSGLQTISWMCTETTCSGIFLTIISPPPVSGDKPLVLQSVRLRANTRGDSDGATSTTAAPLGTSDCCQLGSFCGLPIGGGCPSGGVLVPNATCGATGQCVPLTPTSSANGTVSLKGTLDGGAYEDLGATLRSSGVSVLIAGAGLSTPEEMVFPATRCLPVTSARTRCVGTLGETLTFTKQRTGDLFKVKIHATQRAFASPLQTGTVQAVLTTGEVDNDDEIMDCKASRSGTTATCKK